MAKPRLEIKTSTFRTVLPQPDLIREDLVQELNEFARAYKHGQEHCLKERLTQAMHDRDVDRIRKLSKQLRDTINTPAPALLWRDLNLCTWSR